MSVQEARAEFNHNYYHYEDIMSGGETFYNSEKHVSSGEYGTDKDFGHAVAFAGIVTLPAMVTTGIVGAAFGVPTVGSATLGVGTNVVAQGIANIGTDNSLGNINTIEAVASAVPGIGPAIIGGTFSLPVGNVLQGNFTPSTPSNFNQGALQIGGAILANRFGQKIDTSPILSSETKGGRKCLWKYSKNHCYYSC
ncbi:hypothetical protein [Flavobacterium chilense]|uniref:Uncharacterized protein n=1 Tax=Flavobacterium chilense TaxID=946677 RepID=A0A1M7IU54_9FLAO|nr:hypothetical protein [Flavobacterium chilense]SHM44148.1 hypothetical protein SAMN05444484_10645 [Flavobacterium chilense]